MQKLSIQESTDAYVVSDVRARVHALLRGVTNQKPGIDYTNYVVKMYSTVGSNLKLPVSELGRTELLINDKKQIATLNSMFAKDDFNPREHMDSDKADISGHLVFSANPLLLETVFNESFNNVDYWGTLTTEGSKREIILTILLLDALFLTTFYEYGSKGLKAVLEGRLANTGQWWAWMDLNDFSSASYQHAGDMLHTTKNSSLDASINGASALYPTNMTYARFSGFIRNHHADLSAYNTLINKFSNSNTNEFNLVITEKSLTQFSNILEKFRFHAVAVYTSNMYMFANTYVGYINMWRYNNSVLRKMVE